MPGLDVDNDGLEAVTARDLAEFDAQMPLGSTRVVRSAFMRIASIMMVKDEADIILENLNWQYRQGIRRFVLCDNNSSDGTWGLIEGFRDRHDEVELLLVDDPIVRHIQSEKTTGLARLALSVWPDLHWIAPIDADEFIGARDGFEPLNDLSPHIDALVLPKTFHMRTSDVDESDRSMMAQMPYRSPLFSLPPKVILRANPTVIIGQGNHSVYEPGRPCRYASGLASGFYYREFPIRSFNHFVTKMKNGGRAVLEANRVDNRNVGGGHWVAYYQEYLEGGEARMRELFARDWVNGAQANFIHDPFDVLPEVSG